jgi:hypothetical protein
VYVCVCVCDRVRFPSPLSEDAPCGIDVDATCLSQKYRYFSYILVTLRMSPSLSLEPRFLNACRLRLEAGVRQLLTVGVDLERGTVSVGSRPVSSVERAEASEDPRFDGNGLRMLAAFDARRVVPVLVVLCHPSSVHLFLTPLPWSDGVSCCGLCGAAVCVCSRFN